jgi:hypothetical protein
MTTGGKEVIRTVLGHPLTWVPFAVASIILAFTPWWLGLIAELLAALLVGGIWAGQINRLTAIAEACEQNARSAAEEEKQKSFLEDLYRACPPAGDAYKEAQGRSFEIIQTVKANPWLESFEYGRNSIALMGELEAEAEDIIRNQTLAPRDQWKAHQKSFETSNQALAETLKTMKSTMDEAAKTGGTGRAQALAQEILRKNQASAKIFSELRSGASSEDIEKEKQTS